ncbi:MAG: hypothetical protein IJ970_00325, partial [Mycoplasmataceae bacterium]|nr:hypothetical protein [Mycoplasmataceae bacterium]
DSSRKRKQKIELRYGLRWDVNWNNKITVNLKGKNNNQVSDKNDLYADYLLIETLKNIISKEKNKEEVFLIITFHFYF